MNEIKQASTPEPPLLELREIRKSFPGVVANDGISLNVCAGEIHALLGQNGAGKSTLMKIIYGALQADEGELLWRGTSMRIQNPSQARQLGIGMVFQHFSLFEAFTVEENIALGLSGDISQQALRERLAQVEHQYGLRVEGSRTVHGLSVGERQRIEIVRCLLQNPKLLILDEPTSVLTPQEAERLFETLRRLAAEGCAILYISHKLMEIQALCHRVTILRQGRVVEVCEPRHATPSHLAEMMMGEAFQVARRSKKTKFGAALLEVRKLSTIPRQLGEVPLREISFSISAGEILGIAGVAGNGQSELAEALSGEQPCAAETVQLRGHPVGHLGPLVRRRLGAAFLPEERLGQGAPPEMLLTEVAFLTSFQSHHLTRWGFIAEKPTRLLAETIIDHFKVTANSPDSEARSLSGGNLQKYLVGREILQQPQVFIACQPTWGVDAGAAAAVHQALFDMAAQGAAVLVISQELEEIFSICHRVAAICAGRLSESYHVEKISMQTLGMLMGGMSDEAIRAQNQGAQARSEETSRNKQNPGAQNQGGHHVATS